MKCNVYRFLMLKQLSYSSASPALSDKMKYKRFFRVFPPESSFNPAKFELLKTFNWRKVATLHEAQEIFSLVWFSVILVIKYCILNIITSFYKVTYNLNNCLTYELLLIDFCQIYLTSIFTLLNYYSMHNTSSFV